MGFFDPLVNWANDVGRGFSNFFTGNWSELSKQMSSALTGTDDWSWSHENNPFYGNLYKFGKDFFSGNLGQDIVSPSDDSSDIFKDWDSVDFTNMSEDDMRKWLLNHSESVTPENLSILNGWLNDKYNEGRESTQITRYMEQLKENGINPLMMFGHGAPTGIGTSGAGTRITSAPEGGMSEYQNQMLDMRFIALILAGLRLMV